jgi:hypothetical protein
VTEARPGDADGVFASSARFLFLDYLRVPYSIHRGDGTPGSSLVHRLRTVAHEDTMTRVFYWPSEEGLARRVAARGRVDGITVFARLMPDVDLHPLLAVDGREWTPLVSVSDGERHVASIWRATDGSVALPFDPNEAIEAYWSERYLDRQRRTLTREVLGAARRSYYRVRPVMPRQAQLVLRRMFSRIQARRSFPSWPIEPALHDLYRWLYGLLSEVAGQGIPWLEPWPAPYRWAFVVTHDVETSVGLGNLPRVRAIDQATGVPSSWNFVPERYGVAPGLVDALWEDGFEVGVHGLRHDGRDLESGRLLAERLPAIRSWADAWRARGFRSPATQRDWELMPKLGFDYDTSYSDTDPYEPQPGGCLSWWPYPIGDTIELPITLPQDHTLFVILQQPDERIWMQKSEAIRARDGMALLLAHPDYMLRPEELARYERFLRRVGSDGEAWRPRAMDVAEWWRRRMASTPVRDRAGGWAVSGPAAPDGRVTLEPPR